MRTLPAILITPLLLLLLPHGGSGEEPKAKEEARRSGYWPQWRGPFRRNVSPDKGLLEKWPKDGPPLAWQVEGVGQGVGAVAVDKGKVYLLGTRDKRACLTALDEATGK